MSTEQLVLFMKMLVDCALFVFLISASIALLEISSAIKKWVNKP